jgi:hypothetical protein
MPKRIDTFMLWDDLDLLELRLNILDPVMDLFVIAEGSTDHSGVKKPLHYEDNRERFAPWRDKIRYVTVFDMPGDGFTKWQREFHQRNAIMRGLDKCRTNDLVFLSDLDEIPDPEMVRLNKYGGYHQVYSLYYANMICTTENWTGTAAMYYFQCQQLGMQAVRENRHTLQRVSPGGWHFAYMTPPEKIHQKIRTFAHEEWDKPEVHAQLEQRMKGNRDLFGMHSKPLERIDIQTGYFPEFLKKNCGPEQQYAKYNCAGSTGPTG